MPSSPPRLRGTQLVRRAAGGLAAACLLLAACTEARLDESADGAATTTTSPIGDDSGPGPIGSGTSLLEGMRGVAPGVRLSPEFRDAVRAVDPQVTDFLGAAEGYDIVILLAIATEAARTDAPGPVATGIVASTGGGKVCDDFRSCRQRALDNLDLDYDGRSGRIEMLGDGDPGQAGFAVVEYDGTGALRPLDDVTAQASPLTDPPIEPDRRYGPVGDGTLQIGTLLPLSGPNPGRARAAIAGARVAVDELNAGGGVIGSDVVLVTDDGGDGSVASVEAAANRLIEQGVDAVLGGTTYSVTSVALPILTEAGIILFSPTDTARALSVTADRGLFFRLAAPADLEGRVLGRLVIDDGAARVAIAAGTDPDDLELAADLAAAINAAGGEVTATVSAGSDADADAVARELVASDPQAIVVATTTPMAASLIGVLTGMGKGPRTLPLYGTSADMTVDLATAVGG